MQFISNHNRLLQGGVVYTSYSGGDMWVSGLEYSGDKITGYSGSAFAAECPCDSAAIVDSAYDKTTAWVNEQEFITAHQDVSNLPYVQNSALDYNGLLISGISGDGLYALSAENAFTAEFAYNSQMADSAQTAIYAQSANSALHAEYSNIAQTALSSNNIIGLEYNENGQITGFNGSAFAGGSVTEYSAGDNIDITNYVVSGRNWSNDITAASSYAYEQATAQIPTGLTGEYVENSALKMSGNNITGISGYAVGYSGIPLSSESGVYITKRDNTVIIGYSGTSSPATEYSAGTNIDITNHVISGKSWTNDITAASAYAYSQATAQIPSTVDYSAGNNIDITNHVVSGKDWTNEITAASAYAYNQSTGISISGEFVESSALKLTGTNITGISSYEVGYPRVPVVGSGTVTVTSGTDQVIINGEGIGGVASIFTGGTFANKAISSINFKQAGGSDAESIAFNYSGGSISSQLIPMSTEAGFLYCPGIGRRITTANPDYKYVPLTTASAGATIYITSYNNEVITFITMGDNVNTGVDTTATIIGPVSSITMESGMWVTFGRYYTQSHGLAYAQLGSGWVGGNYI